MPLNSQLSIVYAPTQVPAYTPFQAVFQLTNLSQVSLLAKKGNLVSVGSQNPDSNLTWKTGRIALPMDVAPNQTVQFAAWLEAPGTSGAYNFAWQMVQDYVAWFGNITQPKQIIVGPAASPPANAFNPQLLDLPTNPGDGSVVGQTIVNTGGYLMSIGQQRFLWPAQPMIAKFGILRAEVWAGLDIDCQADMGFEAVRKIDGAVLTWFPLDRYANPGSELIHVSEFDDPGFILNIGDQLSVALGAVGNVGGHAAHSLCVWGKYLQ